MKSKISPLGFSLRGFAVPMEGIMSISGSNPITVSSGTMNTLITNINTKVKMFYWLQPDLSSTSSLIISKGDAGGVTYVEMRAEVSGQSQTIHVGQWMDKLYCRSVPTGTLFIYTC